MIYRPYSLVFQVDKTTSAHPKLPQILSNSSSISHESTLKAIKLRARRSAPFQYTIGPNSPFLLLNSAKAIMNFCGLYQGALPAPSKPLTYLSANFQDHEAGVAQKSLALHSAWLVCVRLLSGGRNTFIFDFCLRAILFFCG